MLDRYERTARDYDGEVELAEKAMWMGRLRKKLARRAYGDVLEVSVGTGRNARYYDLSRCRSVTMLDQSAGMVEVARGKFRGVYMYFRARSITQRMLATRRKTGMVWRLI